MDRAAELIRFQQFMTPSEWLNENMVNCITLEESKILEDKNCVTPGTISQFDLYRYPFAAHRRMWTVTNYFLVNLSLSDLLLAVLNCFFNFVYMLNNDWPFGEVYCRISNFVANVTVAASVFTLTATSFDRFPISVFPSISVWIIFQSLLLSFVLFYQSWDEQSYNLTQSSTNLYESFIQSYSLKTLTSMHCK